MPHPMPHLMHVTLTTNTMTHMIFTTFSIFLACSMGETRKKVLQLEGEGRGVLILKKTDGHSILMAVEAHCYGK